ncbi:MAG: MgtC/SapB family protein [Candidatus Pacebacteria bacterium]|nr:MgtC/SapB family protein [Candidatus Paceibacterota bacterium]
MESIISLFTPDTLDMMIRLLVASGLGLVLGFERMTAHKHAGMRTYALVALGSCLFVIVGVLSATTFASFPGMNPVQIAGSIVIGIGFIGAGLASWKNGGHVELTTTSGIWVAAGIGMACGFGFYIEAMFATLLCLFILAILSILERKFRIAFFGTHPDDDQNEKK